MDKDLIKVDDSKAARQVEFFNSLSQSSDEYSNYLDRLPKSKLERIKRSVA